MRSSCLKLIGFVALSLPLGISLTANASSVERVEPISLESLAQATYPFPDIADDIYVDEIVRASSIGFIAGFSDGTFQPTQSISREEFASMIADAVIIRAPGSFASLPEVTEAPFPDVSADRWSAAKIEFLRDAGLLSGDESGRFRPTDNITRAEIVAAGKRVTELFVEATRPGVPIDTILLPPTPDNSFAFSDTSGHWAEETILTMSANCRVATPLNETGDAFAPDEAALRNYAATTIVRATDCGVSG